MNYFLFRTQYGSSLDPARRVPALEQAIESARIHERKLLATRNALASDLKAAEAEVAETRIDTADTRRHRRDLQEAIRQIDNGFAYTDGVLPPLVPFLNMPGLNETKRAIQELETDLAAWRLLRDDVEERPYRLRDGMRHTVDGRRVLPGETVLLSASRFAAIGDKFEPVAEPAVEEAPVEETPVVEQSTPATS